MMKDTKNPNHAEKSGTPKTPQKHATLVKFLVIVVVSGFVGAGGGVLLSLFRDNAGVIGDTVTAALAGVLPMVQWVVFGVLAVVSLALFGAARTAVFAFEKGGSANESLGDRADTLLGYGMICSNVNQILSYGLFGMLAALPTNIPALLGGVALLVLVIILCTAYSVHSVRLLKRLNPEKQGDPLDVKFQQDFLASCDEGERALMHQAAYQAFRTMSGVILVLWLCTVMVSLFWDIGIYPSVIITILWLTQTVTYQYHAAKNPSSKKKKDSAA